MTGHSHKAKGNRFRIRAAFLILGLGAAIPAQQLGDGASPADVHPGYDLMTIRPVDFRPKVGGMGFMPNGRLVVGTWQPGEVFVLEGAGGTDRGKITAKKMASGFNELLGLEVVDGQVYAMDKTALYRLNDADGDDVAESKTEVVKGWKSGGAFSEYAYGLTYKDGRFYGGLGVAYLLGPTLDNQVPGRGSALEMDPVKGTFAEFAGGLRQPNGMAQGPEGEIFVTDNQGDWLPSCKLIHLRRGAFYGHRQNPPTVWDAKPESPPAVWIPQGEAGASVTAPALMDKGVYAGQLFFGDIYFGGVQRAFLERVGGEFQGAVFRFTGGLEAGINRLLIKDGTLYLGGCGGGAFNFRWRDKLFGLQKMTPGGTGAFEMLAIRSRAKGMEIEFTEPLDAGADAPSRYLAESWRMQPQSSYGGGNKLGKINLPVKSVTLSPDRRKAFLEMDGLQTGRVVHIRLQDIRSAAGKEPWTRDGWYTLNAVSPSAPFQTTTLGPSRALAAGLAWRAVWAGPNLRVKVEKIGPYGVEVLDLRGRLVASGKGQGAEPLSIPVSGRASGIYTVRLKTAGGILSAVTRVSP